MPRSRLRLPSPPDSPRPWDCLVLAADSATRSGWAIWLRGKYVRSGEVGLDLDAIAAIVRDARSKAAFYGVPAVLVLEKPFGQARGRAFGGSGRGRELWRAVWKQQGGVSKRVVQEYPSVWRSRVLPRGCASMRREDVRPIEQLVAAGLVERESAEPPDGRVVAGEDEAPAICIGRWATCAGKVGAALPARLRRTA